MFVTVDVQDAHRHRPDTPIHRIFYSLEGIALEGQPLWSNFFRIFFLFCWMLHFENFPERVIKPDKPVQSQGISFCSLKNQSKYQNILKKIVMQDIAMLR